MVFRSGHPLGRVGRVGRRVRQRLAAIAFRVAVAAQAFFAPAAIAQIPCHYDVAAIIQAPDCGIFGFPPTIGTGISPNGQYVCGYYYQCGASTGYKAFVYKVQTSEFITLPFPPGVVSATAADVNDSGLVAGQYEYTQASSGPYRGFVYDLNAGQYILEVPPLPGGTWSAATGINNAGTVCGWRSIGPGTNPQTAFIWSAADGFTDFGLINGSGTQAKAINASGTVTGTMWVEGAPHPFLWSDGVITDLGTLADLETYPRALNARNDVVGWSALPSNKWPFQGSHAFLWHEGQLTDLGTLAGDNRSVAEDTNSSGVIVGLSRFQSRTQQIDHGFVWHDGTMKDVMDLVGSPGDLVLFECGVITDTGTIMAYSHSSQQDVVSVLLQPAPPTKGDITGNCYVNVDDLLSVINQWGQTESPADVNGDGIVDLIDLLIVLEAWTSN